MAPTILIAGSTGNTGRSVVKTLSKLLKINDTLSNYRILAITRSSNSGAAQQLAKLPSVEVVEQNWVEISTDWPREHEVVRAFIASHNEAESNSPKSPRSIMPASGHVSSTSCAS